MASSCWTSAQPGDWEACGHLSLGCRSHGKLRPLPSLFPQPRRICPMSRLRRALRGRWKRRRKVTPWLRYVCRSRQVAGGVWPGPPRDGSRPHPGDARKAAGFWKQLVRDSGRPRPPRTRTRELARLQLPRPARPAPSSKAVRCTVSGGNRGSGRGARAGGTPAASEASGGTRKRPASQLTCCFRAELEKPRSNAPQAALHRRGRGRRTPRATGLGVGSHTRFPRRRPRQTSAARDRWHDADTARGLRPRLP